MGIIAWIVLGLGAGLLLAYHLLSSRGSTGRSRRRAGWAHR